MLLILCGAFAAAFTSCTTIESKVEDVRSTKYLALGNYTMGKGSVFIMTKSFMAKTVPDMMETGAIRAVESRLRGLGYSIANDPNASDHVMMVMWGVQRAGISHYSISEDTVMPHSYIMHSIEAAFYAANSSGGPGEVLWEARVSEAWGHAKIDPSRMATVLMEKFPN